MWKTAETLTAIVITLAVIAIITCLGLAIHEKTDRISRLQTRVTELEKRIALHDRMLNNAAEYHFKHPHCEVER